MKQEIIKLAIDAGFKVESIIHSKEVLPLNTKWMDEYHDGSAGCSSHKYGIWFEYQNGHIVRFESVVGDCWDSNYAYSQRRESSATQNLGEALYGNGFEPIAVYVAYNGSDSWSGQEDFEENSLTRYPCKSPDFVKIRRRLEDYLRKTSDSGMIMRLAGIAGVKLD